jgi:hypothetical protein
MRSNIYQTYLQPAFLICAVVLAIAASGMSIAIKSLGVHLKKKPCPLKKPLNLLEQAALAPFKVIASKPIENEQIVKELGTEEYVQWILEDMQMPADSTVRNCSLFITYYATADVVPHVPDECYMGLGYQRLSSEGVTFSVDKNGKKLTRPGRCTVFTATGAGHWGSDEKFPVLYMFRVNGLYAGNRDDTRLILNKNLFGESSYYCKVEWKFFNSSLGRVSYPDKEKAVVASQKLLSVVLPVLEVNHWPDWVTSE